MRKLLTAALAASLIAGTAVAAHADYVTASADTETGTVTVGGLTGGTLEVYVEEGKTADVTLAIGVEASSIDGGHNVNQACNLFAEDKSTTVVPSSDDVAVATVPATGLTFLTCADTKTLTVTGVAEGSAAISFEQTFADEAKGTWRPLPTIDVTVTPAQVVVPRTYWRHAPALANAALSPSDCNTTWATNPTKKNPIGTNGHGMLVSYVAQEFAEWHGVASDDPDQIDEIQDALEAGFDDEAAWTAAMTDYASALCTSKAAASPLD